MKMCDEEIAVFGLPIERHDGMADTCDPGNKKLDKKSDAKQHRHLKTDSTAEHRCGPIEHFYPGWNCNEHRGNGEKDIKWTTHAYREHVKIGRASCRERE